MLKGGKNSNTVSESKPYKLDGTTSDRLKRISNQIKELSDSLSGTENDGERKMIQDSITSLQDIKKRMEKLTELNKAAPKHYKELPQSTPQKPKTQTPAVSNGSGLIIKSTNYFLKPKNERIKLDFLERETIKRIKKTEKKEEKKVKKKKPSKYLQLSSKLFYNTSLTLLNKGWFRGFELDLVKANMEFISINYISFMLFTTLISFVLGIFVTLFFLFFDVVATLPFIVATTTPVPTRLLEVFWIMFAFPLATYIFLYFYPAMERKSIASKINHELPFATIHMSSISSSMIEPSKLFNIIVETNEYPTISREFIKLINEINIYGYDLVTALRNSAWNSPSRKLSELFSGIATTITSGGDLPDFFGKRSQTLLFDYRIEREKQSKSAETFMDVYISVVIAAPMILMLLLVMMQVSGLGLSLSTGMITIIMVLTVSTINVLFLAFLHLRNSQT